MRLAHVTDLIDEKQAAQGMVDNFWKLQEEIEMSLQNASHAEGPEIGGHLTFLFSELSAE